MAFVLKVYAFVLSFLTILDGLTESPPPPSLCRTNTLLLMERHKLEANEQNRSHTDNSLSHYDNYLLVS